MIAPIEDFRSSDWVMLDGYALWLSRHSDLEGWESGVLSEDRGEKKQCFYNAWTRAMQGAGFYTEGFAKGHYTGWTHHAWLTDEDGNAVEVTWDSADLPYVGIVIEDLEELGTMIEEDDDGEDVLYSYITTKIRDDVTLADEVQQRLRDWREDLIEKSREAQATELQNQQ